MKKDKPLDSFEYYLCSEELLKERIKKDETLKEKNFKRYEREEDAKFNHII